MPAYPQAGDPLRISARDWGDMLRVVDWWRRSGPPQLPTPSAAHDGTILAFNETGADLDRGSVCELVGSLHHETVPPPWKRCAVRARIVIDPSSIAPALGVALSPIADGTSGRFQVVGGAVALVDVLDVNHRRAEAVDGSTRFQSCEVGGDVPIMHFENLARVTPPLPATGPQPCLVLLGQHRARAGYWITAGLGSGPVANSYVDVPIGTEYEQANDDWSAVDSLTLRPHRTGWYRVRGQVTVDFHTPPYGGFVYCTLDIINTGGFSIFGIADHFHGAPSVYDAREPQSYVLSGSIYREAATGVLDTAKDIKLRWAGPPLGGTAELISWHLSLEWFAP